MDNFYFIAGESCSDKTGELIPNTHYKLYRNRENAAKIIDDALFAFNKKCVTVIQSPEIINICYVVKEDDVFIAGISVCCYIWKIMHIDLMFVEESHRHKAWDLLIKKSRRGCERIRYVINTS